MSSGTQLAQSNNEILSLLTNNRMFGGNNIYSFKELLLNILRDIVVNNVKNHVDGISLRVFIMVSMGLLGLMEFKDPIKNFIITRSKAAADYLLLINYMQKIMNVKFKLSNLLRSRKTYINSNEDRQLRSISSVYEYDYEWIINEQFVNSFYYFMKNSGQCEFLEDSTKIRTVSLQESFITSSYNKLTIKIPNTNMYIKIIDGLAYDINIIKSIPMYIGITNKDTYLNLLGDPELIAHIEKGYKEIIKWVETQIGENRTIKDIVNYLHNKYVGNCYTMYGCIKDKPFNVCRLYYIGDAVLDILISYPKLDKYETWLYIFVLEYIYTLCAVSIISVCNSTRRNQYNPHKTNIHSIYKTFSNIYDQPISINISDELKKKITGLNSLNSASFNLYNDKYWIGQYSEDDMNKILNNKSTNKNNMNMKIKIVSESKISNSDRNKTINDLIKNINTYTKIDGSKIKTFDIGMKSKKEFTRKPNPEYLKWENRKNRLTAMSNPLGNANAVTNGNTSGVAEQRDDIKTDGDSKMNSKIMGKLIMNMPEAEIEVMEEKFELYCNQINEDYTRTLDTLYLQQECENNLMSILEIFRDRKEDMIELGIKHKLNIMLHGLPGTGKTTTIHAVASYLQRDIYYLNLNEIRTNQQLKDIFDYMSKTVAKGGIVVIEDIDAMTAVVLDRTKYNNSHNTELTLEYFLNILQGTLTRDDSIFIITTNHLEKLDAALVRAGRFDCLIELKYANHYQISKIYKRILKRIIPKELLTRITEYKYSPADFIHHFIKFILNGSVSDEQILERFIN